MTVKNKLAKFVESFGCKNCKHFERAESWNSWGFCRYFDIEYEYEEFLREFVKNKPREGQLACMVLCEFAGESSCRRLAVHENFFCANFEPKDENELLLK